jgi:hypothetical protein
LERVVLTQTLQAQFSIHLLRPDSGCGKSQQRAGKRYLRG